MSSWLEFPLQSLNSFSAPTSRWKVVVVFRRFHSSSPEDHRSKSKIWGQRSLHREGCLVLNTDQNYYRLLHPTDMSSLWTWSLDAVCTPVHWTVRAERLQPSFTSNFDPLFGPLFRHIRWRHWSQRQPDWGVPLLGEASAGVAGEGWRESRAIRITRSGCRVRGLLQARQERVGMKGLNHGRFSDENRWRLPRFRLIPRAIRCRTFMFDVNWWR